MGSKSRNTPPAQDDATDPPAEESLDDRLDEALEETFPASDPPAVHRIGAGTCFLP